MSKPLRWLPLLAAAAGLAASAVAAAPPPLPAAADWARRIDTDLARGDAADLAVAQNQLQALIQDARGPRAPAGRLAAVASLFDVAYAKLLARCPAAAVPDSLVQGFGRLAVSLGRPVRARAVCAGVGGGYVVSGGGNGLKVSGTVSDIAHPFTIKGTIIGGVANFTFTPDQVGAFTGKVRYTIAGSGVTGDGSGTYRMTSAGGGVIRLTDAVTGCVHGGGCRTTTEIITLTPTGRR